MHKNDFFPLYFFHITRFHSVTSNPKSFSPAATLDPRPRLWTRDPDFGPATRDPRLLVKLSERTSSLSRSAMIYVWVSWPWVLLTNHYWSCQVGKIHIYLILKIKNRAMWEIKRVKVWKSKISWKIKVKHQNKNKKIFFLIEAKIS